MDSISSSYLNNISSQAFTTSTKNNADSIVDSAKNLSKSSSKEDLRNAVKSFEGYFLEQVIKKEKENIDMINDDDKDLTTSQLEDFYMDQTITKVASEMVDKNFDSMTDEFVESMSRTYHISDEAGEESDEAGKESNVAGKESDKAGEEKAETNQS